MAKRNNNEVEPLKHTFLKILGGVFVLLSFFMLVLSIYCLRNVTHPQEMIEQPITPHMIVRLSTQVLYWGYPTVAQSNCFTYIASVFEYMALAAYCFFFKSSFSKWWVKVAKILFCIAFYCLYVSATDFHYFDINEWIAPVLFVVMAIIALRNNKKETDPQLLPQENITNPLDSVDKTNGDCESNSLSNNNNTADEHKFEIDQDDKSFTPRIIKESITINNSPNDNNQNLTKSTQVDNEEPMTSNVDKEMKYCRHCGSIINYKVDVFCKHCGKKII